MFWRIVSASLRHQRGRLSLAVLAMTLGSALISGLLNLSGDVGGQVGQELRAYGANLLIRPFASPVVAGSGSLEFGPIASPQTLPESDLAAIRQTDSVEGAVPYLYAVVEAEDQPIMLTGVDLQAAEAVNAWWKIQGRWPQNEEEILLGVRAATALDAAVGDSIELAYDGQTQTARVVGILETGGTEDDQGIASLRAVQAMTDQPGQVQLVMVSALTTDRSLDAVVRDLQARLPNADVQALAQFAGAETTVLHKVRLLLGVVAVLVLLCGVLTVSGTLQRLVLERQPEIGLMKALGAADRQVAWLFVAEALSIGAAGGLSGYAAGLLLAFAIEQQVFSAALTPTVAALPGTLLAALSVALLAALLPVRRAVRVDPVRTLRGE